MTFVLSIVLTTREPPGRRLYPRAGTVDLILYDKPSGQFPHLCLLLGRATNRNSCEATFNSIGTVRNDNLHNAKIKRKGAVAAIGATRELTLAIQKWLWELSLLFSY